MISFAKYLEEENNYVWSIYNLEGPSQPYTDFKITSVIFDGSWGTTAQNIYGPAEMGTYAGIVKIKPFPHGWLRLYGFKRKAKATTLQMVTVIGASVLSNL